MTYQIRGTCHEDGSRRVIRSEVLTELRLLPERVVLEVNDGPTPSCLLGTTAPTRMTINIHSALYTGRGLEGWYLPYPPADGIASVPTEAPVNQVPYERDFLNHCLHVRSRAADGLPPARADGYATSTPGTLAPDLELDVDSIQRNRVGMRYYRGVLGYFYDQIVRFGAHPRNPDGLGQFETDWRTELSEMQGLDRYVCGECRDEGGGSRLRDFIHLFEHHRVGQRAHRSCGERLRFVSEVYCPPAQDRPKQPRQT